MDITQAHHIINIRFMGLGCQRIPKENYKIDFIVLNLCPYLLSACQMPGKKLVDVQIRSLTSISLPVRTRSKKLVFSQNSSVSNAEVLHKLFLCVMRNQCNIHSNLLLLILV